MKYFFSFLLCLCIHQTFFAQEKKASNPITGSFDVQTNYFIRDSAIGAYNIPQYDHLKFGAQGWLNLNYSNNGFDIGLRFDAFQNSNLLVPTQAYTAQGIGNWYIKKRIDKFDFAGGYLYGQIGSGIIFRAYEERPLAIDNALIGFRVGYRVTPNINIKAFTGKQKQQLSSYNSIIRGASAEGFFTLGDSTKSWTIAPGVGVVGRTFDKTTVDQMVAAVSSYTVIDSIPLQYNSYAFTAYNTLNAGPITWYIEGAYKTTDVFNNPFAIRTLADGTTSNGKLENKPGSVVYTSLGYAGKGLGITVEGKRTENFTFRTTPFETLNRGMLNFLPPMSRQNTYRLAARYNAATQELGEQAIQVEARYKPSKHFEFMGNFSHIQKLNNTVLYRERLIEGTYKTKKNSFILGLQIQNYNQQIYEVKPKAPMVKTFTVYTEYLHKFSRKRSIRLEAQHMLTHQDYGSWMFGLAEFSMAPHWIFTASSMYNYQPKKTSKINYPTCGVTYVHHSTRVMLNYVKQVEGVVCTGGICRLEPAFSGVRLNVNTTF